MSHSASKKKTMSRVRKYVERSIILIFLQASMFFSNFSLTPVLSDIMQYNIFL